jgi:hypothetical protein
MYLLTRFENVLTSAVVDISHDKLSLTQPLKFSLPHFLSRRMLRKWFLQRAQVYSMPSPDNSGQHLGVQSDDVPWFAELSPHLQKLYKLTSGESGAIFSKVFYAFYCVVF